MYDIDDYGRPSVIEELLAKQHKQERKELFRLFDEYCENILAVIKNDTVPERLRTSIEVEVLGLQKLKEEIYKLS